MTPKIILAVAGIILAALSLAMMPTVFIPTAIVLIGVSVLL